jgi:hypothetical protein
VDASSPIALWCPMPAAINPSWRTWEQDALTWAQRHRLTDGKCSIDRLRQILVGELAGRVLPTVRDPRGGQFATDSLLWLFVFDDLYCDEGRFSHDPAAMAMLAADLVRIAETGDTTTADPIVRALADLRGRLDHLATSVATARWVRAVKGYLHYQVWEAAHRSTGTVPTVDQYAVARIRNGSMEVCTLSLDIAGGYEVPATEIDLPAIRALTEMTCLVVGLDNDIASYHKEHERGTDYLNLVDVLAHEHRGQPHDTLPEVILLRDSILELYMRMRDQVSPHVSVDTQRYLRGLSTWIRGNLDWSIHTGRYRAHGKPTIEVTTRAPRAAAARPTLPGISWWWDHVDPPITLPRQHSTTALVPGGPAGVTSPHTRHRAAHPKRPDS